MKELKGTLILLLAAFIWGMSFVAQSTASGVVEPFTYNGIRLLIGALFLTVFLCIRKGVSKTPILEKTTQTGKIISKKQTLVAGTICGVVLFFATNLQQFGIEMYPEGVATSGRSAFLTATYVVMIAIVGSISSKKIQPYIILAVIVCMGGMFGLCFSNGLSGVYFADLLGFACAIFFTAHIIVIDRFCEIDSTTMSCVQFYVSGILSLICMIVFETPNLDAILSMYIPILYSGIGSSGIAYTLQIIGQKYSKPATASIAMSLESVFAALGGAIILAERLNGIEILGCALVFIAVILAQIPQFIKPKK
ncbi:MAG: DMT family transporter [Clostridia bacterium]|nr:DMT family transporter [Clostridia bacterium]